MKKITYRPTMLVYAARAVEDVPAGTHGTLLKRVGDRWLVLFSGDREHTVGEDALSPTPPARLIARPERRPPERRTAIIAPTPASVEALAAVIGTCKCGARAQMITKVGNSFEAFCFACGEAL